MLIILFAAFIAAIVSEEQLQNKELFGNSAADLVPEEQRFRTRYYRVLAIRLAGRGNKEKGLVKPSAIINGYSGYQSGYGFFRGRRSASTETEESSS